MVLVSGFRLKVRILAGYLSRICQRVLSYRFHPIVLGCLRADQGREASVGREGKRVWEWVAEVGVYSPSDTQGSTALTPGEG